jgi:hypothetical protein
MNMEKVSMKKINIIEEGKDEESYFGRIEVTRVIRNNDIKAVRVELMKISWITSLYVINRWIQMFSVKNNTSIIHNIKLKSDTKMYTRTNQLPVAVF